MVENGSKAKPSGISIQFSYVVAPDQYHSFLYDSIKEFNLLIPGLR